jgi:mercuric ion transport protein
MQSVARTLHAVVAWLVVIGLVVQVWLAGRGVFDPTTGFTPHRDLGYALGLLPIVLLALGLIGRMGRRVAIMAIVLFLLVILQSAFVALRASNPAIAALHPVNGFAILLIAILLARESWTMRAQPA